jgi:hypothetical protein
MAYQNTAHCGPIWIVKWHYWQTTRQNGPFQVPIRYSHLTNSSSQSKFNFQLHLMVVPASNTVFSHIFCCQYTNRSKNLPAMSCIFNIVHFPCSCFIYTDLLITDYCTIVFHLLHFLAAIIQPSSGRNLLQRDAPCNMLHAAYVCKRVLHDDGWIIPAETYSRWKTIVQ